MRDGWRPSQLREGARARHVPHPSTPTPTREGTSSDVPHDPDPPQQASETDETTHSLAARLGAETFGTFWLVLGGVGAAVLAGDEIGFAGVALAFGLSVLSAAYAVGHVSGGHFNPAVSIGVAVAGRFSWRDVPAYVAAQVVGALLGAAAVLAIASGRDGFSVADGFATNGYGAASPAGYDWWAAAVAELVLTAGFVYVILGVTHRLALKHFGPLAIGLALTLIHLVSIPVDNTSVNPARSLAPALFQGGAALEQLWVFVVFPVLGAVIAGLTHTWVVGRR